MVANDLNDYLVNCILGDSPGESCGEAVGQGDAIYSGKGKGVSCNEWGGMLLYDQVSELVSK
jgi:hypothetical protein